MSDWLDISPMSEADLDWVVENEHELHLSPWSSGNFSDALTAGYGAWVVRRADRRIGYAVMLMVLDEAHLLNLSVARAMHRSGVGSALLRYLLDEARRRSAKQFFLEVRPSNTAALALYERHGFVSIGRRKHYYPEVHGVREDAIVLRLGL